MGSSDTQAVGSERALDQQRMNESAGPSGQAPAEAPWGTVHKVAFRFAFSYLCLYLYPFSATLGWFWWFWVRWEEHTYETPWRQLVPWVSAHVRLRYPVSVGFGGDSTYEYVKVLCFVFIAALATIVWSVIDRKRVAYTRLNQCVRFYVRLVVAYTMIGFGTLKVIPVQAPFPDLVTLMQPFGDLGANRIFWTFLGTSAGYMVFAGLVETLGGVLLLIPGMTTLGALVSLGALVAVFTQSGFYGVPVVLGVAHLILLALFLVLPDLRRLINLFVLNRVADPQPSPPLLRRRWANYSLWGIQWGLGIYLIAMMLSRGLTETRLRSSVPVTTPLYGLWKVNEFTANGQVHPPILTDNLRWQRVIFDSDTRLSPRMIATIQDMDGQFCPYVATLDKNTSTLSLSSPSKTELIEFQLLIHTQVGGQGQAQLNYNRLSPDAMILEGLMNGNRFRVTLKKEERQFALKTLGFHWITDKDVAY